MKYFPLKHSCEHCIPSLELCIRHLSISTFGSSDVLGEHVSCQPCILLLTTCKHGQWHTSETRYTSPRWRSPKRLSWRHASKVRSRTMKISRSPSLVYRLPMHGYLGVWIFLCMHTRSHLLGHSPRQRQRHKSNWSLTRTLTSWCA